MKICTPNSFNLKYGEHEEGYRVSVNSMEKLIRLALETILHHLNDWKQRKILSGMVGVFL